VLAAEPDIELMLLDINMPVMDGLTLLAELQQRQSRNPSSEYHVEMVRLLQRKGACHALGRRSAPLSAVT